jgi:hypothetical protein
MPKHRTLDEVYGTCVAEDIIQDILIAEPQKAKDLVINSDIYREGALDRAKLLPKDDSKWMLVYVDYYEAIRLLADALAHLEKKRITNHQCLFAYLCKSHPGLELDFDFFERIRTKRNGVNYHGQRLTHDDWKQVELQMNLYADALKGEVERRLNA